MTTSGVSLAVVLAQKKVLPPKICIMKWSAKTARPELTPFFFAATAVVRRADDAPRVTAICPYTVFYSNSQNVLLPNILPESTDAAIYVKIPSLLSCDGDRSSGVQKALYCLFFASCWITSFCLQRGIVPAGSKPQNSYFLSLSYRCALSFSRPLLTWLPINW